MVGTAGAIVITVLVLAAVAAVSWVLYSRWRAQKLGLPPPPLTSCLPFGRKSDNAYGPTPRAGGLQGWIGDQVTKFKNRNNHRTAAGAYEGAPAHARGTRGGGGGGFGPLDPDAAWDARVGDEADYGPAGYGDNEEHELGLGLGPYGRNSTAYEGAAHGGSLQTDDSSYVMNLAATPRMGPEQELGREARGRGANRNPFDDDSAEPSNLSLRGVSPRPMEGEHHRKSIGDGGSPTERRSIFTEQV